MRSAVATRALITGGAGFLGSHLCRRLLARGTEVVCLDNLATADGTNIADLKGDPNFRLLRGDVTRPPAVPGRFDLVMHLASAASPTHYQRLPIATLRAGSVGTENAVSLAAEHGARFVLASTSEVYGDPQEHPQQEDYRGNVNPIGPRSMYDESKRYAEALTVAYQREHGVNTGIARIFNTYGPGMHDDDGRMIPAFARQAVAGEPITVHGDGGQTRSLCYVDDTVAGLIALAASDRPGPINIGNPHELRVTDIAELVRELAGSESPIRYGRATADDPRRRCPDITRARVELGWEPATDLQNGLNQTMRWFREVRPHGTAPEPLH